MHLMNETAEMRTDDEQPRQIGLLYPSTRHSRKVRSAERASSLAGGANRPASDAARVKLGVSECLINSPKAKHTINTPNSAMKSAQPHIRAQKSTNPDNELVEDKNEAKIDQMVLVTDSAEHPQAAEL